MNSSKWSVMGAAAAIVSVAMCGIGVTPGHAKDFSNKSVKGVYSCVGGFNSEWVPGSGGSPSTKLEFADVAQIALDGNGNFQGSESDILQCAFQDCGQFTCDGSTAGTYSTNPDGSGTAQVTITYQDQVNCGTFTGTLNMNIGSFGKTINFIQRTGASTIGGITTPVDSAVLTLYCTKASE